MEDMNTAPNFTPRAQEIIKRSKEIASQCGDEFVSLSHLFFSLLLTNNFSTEAIFSKLSLSKEELLSLVQSDLESLSSNSELKSDEGAIYSDEVKLCLSLANEISIEYDHQYIGVEHLFHALISVKKSVVVEYFESFKVSKAKLKKIIIKTFEADSDLFSTTAVSPGEDLELTEVQDSIESTTSLKNLNKFAVNYNELYENEEIDDIVGKEFEIQKISEILCRRKKNNPILLGDAGVGKSAVVEGLAGAICKGQCSDFLMAKKIFGLDLAALIAGTKYRGQFEDRLKKIMEEVKLNKNIILFIDEIHTLVGAGGAEGAMDAANILKPMLARGELNIIGATTYEEYKKSLEKDAAMARRFEPVALEEPSAAEARLILEGIKHYYESFHKVKYPEGIIELIIDLSNRFMTERNFPDKAIDILDQAGAKTKIKSFCRPESARVLEKEIEDLMDLEPLPDEVEEVKAQQEQLFDQYKEALTKWAKKCEDIEFKVSKNDVYQIVSEKCKIPIKTLSRKVSNRVSFLRNKLKKIIIGQDLAVNSVCDSLLRSELGFGEEEKPIGSFLFLGATGVGKTLTAKEIALNYFGHSNNFISYDMSEFSDRISANKFIGSAPGYVGHEEGGGLVDKIRKNPHSLVLFDEIEKAHSSVTQILLQILEEGKLTDSLGRTAYFNNSIIIMTGNIGSSLLGDKMASLGFSSTEESNFEAAKTKISKEAQSILSPELFNRLDELVVFNNFDDSDLMKIINIELKNFNLRVKETHGFSISVPPSIKNIILNSAKDEKLGARPVKRQIKTFIQTVLANYIINNKIDQGSIIKYYLSEGKIACGV
jgi:ATP-dependent Clp protease ATP-binding subunit ClpC